MKTKRYYAEQVKLLMENDYQNIDFKTDERQIFILIDQVVNRLARESYFENWKVTGADVDEQFITTFDLTVVDQLYGKPSYIELPINYASLPWNAGINEIYPLKWNALNQPAVVIMSHTDFRRYANNAARGMAGRLFGYLEGYQLIFGICDVGKKYGTDFGGRFVVRDSSLIGEDQVYPIPSDQEDFVIKEVMKVLTIKRAQDTDVVRDNVDKGAS